MKSGKARIAPEIVDCISEGRRANADELFRVAAFIWNDMRSGRSAFGWGELTSDSSERVLSLRAAQAALAGGG
jgi:hypothetical protein